MVVTQQGACVLTLPGGLARLGEDGRGQGAQLVVEVDFLHTGSICTENAQHVTITSVLNNGTQGACPVRSAWLITGWSNYISFGGRASAQKRPRTSSAPSGQRQQHTPDAHLPSKGSFSDARAWILAILVTVVMVHLHRADPATDPRRFTAKNNIHTGYISFQTLTCAT